MAIHPVVREKQAEIEALCRKHRVCTLHLFGSAAIGGFDPTTSDLDFVVEFEDMPTLDRGASFWGLLFDLEDLFARRIDLVVRRALRNPYFIRELDGTQEELYAA